ncbi:MAG: ribonuclease HII [Candidatus Hadarchaeia archaeon]
MAGPPKGPVLGPMVICGIEISPRTYGELKAERVRDSKKIGENRRAELAELIRKRAKKIEFVEFWPGEIDRMREGGTNLNEIEAIGFAELLDLFKASRAYIDSASANSEEFARALKGLCEKDSMRLIVEHKADENYLPVSAASIMAKVRRDGRIEELKEDYGEIGSGYPADERTVRFLEDWIKRKGELPAIARKTWKTAKRMKGIFDS